MSPSFAVSSLSAPSRSRICEDLRAGRENSARGVITTLASHIEDQYLCDLPSQSTLPTHPNNPIQPPRREVDEHEALVFSRLTTIPRRLGSITRLQLTGLVLLAVTAAATTPARAQTAQPARERHIVVVVFDGLRADSVTEQDMPNLYALAQSGTRFSRHHPVYPSSTEVNGTALATGGYPKHTGIMANNEYRPDIDPLKSVAVEVEAVVRKGDANSTGQFIQLPTVAEILRKAGLRTAIAGTKGAALLLDRAERDARIGEQSEAVVEGKSLSPGLLTAQENTAFPAKADSRKSPNRAQDEWTTRMLIHQLWAKRLPAYSVLWLSDPDYTQHGFGPNAVTARQALHNSDEDLGPRLRGARQIGCAESNGRVRRLRSWIFHDLEEL
jgi:Type I phosphodiesterase / nucleotide pyrophosphatase